VGVGSSSDALGSFLQISFFVAAGGRRRFVAIALELEENAEGARVGSGVAGFHAMENVEGAAVGEAFERFGERLVGRERVVGVFLDVVDGFGEELGFDAGDAVEAPFGGNHLVDEVEFDGSDGRR